MRYGSPAKKKEKPLTYNIIICGVGGQGVISLATIIAESANSENLFVKQVEVHGMAQRGGSVVSHIRISDAPIASNQIPFGKADMILSTEPLETVRHLPYLRTDTGTCITSTIPVTNIPDYPEITVIREQLSKLSGVVLIDADLFSDSSMSRKMLNVVLLGTASHYLPLQLNTIRSCLLAKFAINSDERKVALVTAFDRGRAIGGSSIFSL